MHDQGDIVIRPARDYQLLFDAAQRLLQLYEAGGLTVSFSHRKDIPKLGEAVAMLREAIAKLDIPEPYKSNPHV